MSPTALALRPRRGWSGLSQFAPCPAEREPCRRSPRPGGWKHPYPQDPGLPVRCISELLTLISL